MKVLGGAKCFLHVVASGSLDEFGGISLVGEGMLMKYWAEGGRGCDRRN